MTGPEPDQDSQKKRGIFARSFGRARQKFSNASWRFVGKFSISSILLFFLLRILWLLVQPTIDRYTREISDPSPSIVEVVMPFSGPGEKTAKQIWDATQLAYRDHCAIDREHKPSCDSKILQLKFDDDGGDETRAREVAARLTQDKHVVAVIGHLTSSVTKSALQAYCVGEDPMPIVMPIATATHLVDEARDLGCSGVLRLPPTNLEIGQKSARLLQYLSAIGSLHPNTKLGSHTIVVFRDLSNPTYSDDLAKDFEYSLRHTYYDGAWQVILDQGIAGDNGGVIVTSEIKNNFPANVIFIAGMTDAVLQTLREAKLAHWKPALTLLTDGAFSEDLLASGKDILTNDTYLVFPTNTLLPSVKTLNQQLGLTLDEISYAPYGYDSAKLLFAAIDNIGASGKGVTRKRLRSVIAGWKSNSVGWGANTFLFFDHYSFDSKGNALDAPVTLYRYDSKEGQFRPITDSATIEP